MNTVQIKQQLELAWQEHIDDRPALAFEHLHGAVKLMVEACEAQDKENARVSNYIDCVSNGIQPD